MTSKILKCIISITVTVLVLISAIGTGILYHYFGNIQEAQLEDELNLAAEATEQQGINYLNNLTTDQSRLTWIAADGSVIFDSCTDETSMENHADREEVRAALTYGTGSSVRRSSTLTEQTIYEAKRLEDGSVLRISISRATVFALVLGMVKPVAFVLLITVMISAWMAGRMARSITEPLNRLDLENPMDNDAYEELSPLLYRIHEQHLEIEKQMQILKCKQHEFEQITSSMKEALVLLDSSDRILSINPAARELFGADRNCTGDDFLSVDRKQKMRLSLEEVKEKGYSSFRDKKNGREYQFDLSRIDSDGNNRGVVILAFDITDQVNAENHRREFTANVSHELKTPLQSIIGSAELMENGIVKDEDVPRFVKQIHREASRLVSLIDDIIRLSQLDEGQEMPREEVSLRLLSEEVCETLANAAEQKGVSLKVEGGEGIVNGVRRLLYEAVYNLCDNAIKYNNPGGSVIICISEEDGKTRLSVKDTGIGISHEHQEKVFERFYRVDKSHSKKSGGTGLGLSIVKRAVQYHNGRIFIESEPGKGTDISFILT